MAKASKKDDIPDARKPREEWEPNDDEGIPKDAGMIPLGGQAREEWEPQQNPGPINLLGNPRETDDPDILRSVSANTKTTGLKKGGPVNKIKKPSWRRW